MIEIDLINDPSQNQEVGNQNDEQRNISLEINVGLVIFKTLSHELRGTREPSHLSLASSLETMVASIENAQM